MIVYEEWFQIDEILIGYYYCYTTLSQCFLQNILTGVPPADQYRMVNSKVNDWEADNSCEGWELEAVILDVLRDP